LHFNGRDAVGLAQQLSGECIEVLESSIPTEVYQQLCAGSFIVPTEADELLEIRERFRRARAETPMALTITTTMDCNLGCYYCYEERSGDKLAIKELDEAAGCHPSGDIMTPTTTRGKEPHKE
jgi:uncharacterized protein